MKDDSTRRPSRRKARLKLPRPDFPLRIHQGTGYWCKKVRGQVHYFGKVADDPKGQVALEKWLEQKDDLLAGREPRAKFDGLTVADLCNDFLAHKEHLRDNGELSPRTFRGYYDTAACVVETFRANRIVTDISPQDFGRLRAILAKTRGAVALRNEMQRVRTIFKFAFDQGLILAPVRFGQSFAKPKLDIIRKAREKHREQYGDRMFESEELRAILAACGQPLRSMVLLAANCAFGQSDLARLPLRAVDLSRGWVDFARPKTGVSRRIPLWPETIEAIREWIPLRPRARNRADAGLLFLTVCGAPWVKVSERGAPKDAVLQEFNKVVCALGMKRSRRGFYSLRHSFQTVADETTDGVAVGAIMGHILQGMAAHYRERIGDDRLRRVVNHVHRWLFAPTPDTAPSPEKENPENPEKKGLGSQKTVQDLEGDTRPKLRLFAG